MTLEEFLNELDQGLKEYDYDLKKQKPEIKQSNDTSTLFMKYFCAYITDGTNANAALRQATDLLLNDNIFLTRLKSCIMYVMAMTAAAIMSSDGRKETNNEERK